MSPGYLPHHRKSEAEPRYCVRRQSSPIESLKDSFRIRASDAWPIVPDPESDLRWACFGADLNGRLARRMLQGIVEELPQGELNQVAIDVHRGNVAARDRFDRPIFQSGSHLRNHRFDQLVWRNQRAMELELATLDA